YRRKTIAADRGDCSLDDERRAQTSRHSQRSAAPADRARKRQQRERGESVAPAFQPDAQADEERWQDETDDGANVPDEELTCEIRDSSDSFPPLTFQPLNHSTSQIFFMAVSIR